MKRCSIASLHLMYRKRLPVGSLKLCPRTTQQMFTHKVRLEAGPLHLAKYLIWSAVYILSAKLDKIRDMQNVSLTFIAFTFRKGSLSFYGYIISSH